MISVSINNNTRTVNILDINQHSSYLCTEWYRLPLLESRLALLTHVPASQSAKRPVLLQINFPIVVP